MVVSDPGIAGVEPIFRDPQAPAATLFGLLEDGVGPSEILWPPSRGVPPQPVFPT
jgi:hypothetical protein